MIAVFSLAGAPGVTTLSLALAGVWPGAGPVRMVEADASGGDVAAWWHLPPWPGVVDLAAASRSGQDHEQPDLTASTQVLPGGIRACVAPPTAERTSAALELLSQNPKALHQGTSIVDLGRLAPQGTSSGLLGAADLAIVVCSGDIAQLKRVKETTPWLFRAGPQVGLAVVGARSSETEISEVVGLPVWARLPWDPKAARFLTGQGEAARIHRRPLIRTARSLAQTLNSRTQPAATGQVEEVR